METLMRIIVAFAAGATLLLSACAQTPKPPEVAKAVAQENWVLIAPPDNVVTVAFLDTFEFLPEHKANFPGSTNGLSEQHRASLERLFEQVAAEPAAEERLEILTEVSALTDAPIEQWREVRVFKSAAACNTTRDELIKVTSEQTRKFGAYARMPREEFQWPLLARSFEWSRCVPAEMAPSVL
jgi:hypothetical protein